VLDECSLLIGGFVHNMCDLREEIPQRAFINVQILQQARYDLNFQAIVEEVAGTYGIVEYEFMNRISLLLPACSASRSVCCWQRCGSRHQITSGRRDRILRHRDRHRSRRFKEFAIFKTTQKLGSSCAIQC